MRKLASIQKVVKVEPIKGADRIELATVLGWHVIVEKGQFKPGDLCIYVEIDSVLPTSNPHFEFLEKRSKGRIRTMKMRGVYSQGICFLPSILADVGGRTDLEEGTDVTDLLNVKKYEADERNGNSEWWKKQETQQPKKWYMKYRIGRWFWRHFVYQPKSTWFPIGFACKTDETRVQVLGNTLEEYKGTACQATEKVDGSSITFWVEFCHIGENKLHVCSRNREILDEDDFMYRAAAKLKDKCEPNYVYQGEIIGPNIQGNKYKLNDYRILLYQMWIPRMQKFLSPPAFIITCNLRGFEHVPIINCKFDLTDDIDALVNMSIGKSTLADTPREGIVIRPLHNVENLINSYFVGGRLSFKVINPEFLVKYKL